MTVLLLLAGLLLYAFARSVRSRGLRDGLFLLAGLAAGFSVGVLPLLAAIQNDYSRNNAVQAATLHLTAPQTVSGIDFPAGSTLHPDPDGTVRWGNVPQATIIKGMPLTGDFRLGPVSGTDPPGGIAMSTLANATEVRGVPCGPGPFVLQQEGLRCTLDRDYDYLGHVLMHGQVFEVGRPLAYEPIALKVGTLAQPEQLDDATWPAGTVVGMITEPADQLRHNPDVVGYPVRICLKPGTEVAVQGATLHGPIVYSFSHNQRDIDVTCWPLTTFSSAPPRYSDGYAEVGNERFHEGVWSSERGWLKVR